MSGRLVKSAAHEWRYRADCHQCDWRFDLHDTTPQGTLVDDLARFALARAVFVHAARHALTDPFQRVMAWIMQR